MELTFQRSYSRALRLWHWCSFLVVSLLLMTVIAGKFFLNDYTNGFVVKDQLAREGISLTMGQAFQVSSVIGKGIWKLHIFLGYILSGLFGFRILLEFYQPKEQTIRYRIKKASQCLIKSPEKKRGLHHLLVQIIYVVFYLLSAALIVTGLWLVFGNAAKFPGTIHQVKELHQLFFFILLIFIVIHLAGVIRAERKEHQNLVSNMIHGGIKQQPE